MWWNRPKTCEGCERLHAEFKTLKLTVEEIQDKVYHWMKRHSARAARDDVAASKPEAPADNGDTEFASPRVPGLLRRTR